MGSDPRGGGLSPSYLGRFTPNSSFLSLPPSFFRPISDLPPLLSLSPPKPLLEAAPWDPKPRSPVSSSPPSLPSFLSSPFGVGVSIPLSSSSEVGRVGCSDGRRRPLLYTPSPRAKTGRPPVQKGGRKKQTNFSLPPHGRQTPPPPFGQPLSRFGLDWRSYVFLSSAGPPVC